MRARRKACKIPGANPADLIIEEVRTLTLGPDDVIVLKIRMPAPNQALLNLRGSLEAAFPKNKVIVLESCLDMEIIRPCRG